MAGKTRHVVPHKDGWANKRGGADKPTSVHKRQKDAIDSAREQSRKEGSELFIHRKDGTIREKDSHGNDPRNIKG